MVPKLIAIFIGLVMTALVISPLNFGRFYILFRPLVQPLATEHYTLFSSTPLTGAFAIGLVGYSTFICTFRRDHTLFPPNVIFLYLLIVLSSFSLTYSLDHGLSGAHLLKILTAIALYNLTYSAVKTIEDARKVIFAIVLTSVIPMLIGYYQFFAAVGARGLMGMTNRITGGLGMANAYGIFLAICFCAGLMLLFQKSDRLKRLSTISVIASMVVSSILALNRGTWIALSASLIFSYLLYRREIKGRWLIVAGVLVGICFSGMIAERFMQLQETTPWGATRNTFAGRVENWKAILRLVPRHPIAGFGVGTSSLVMQKFYRVSSVPHNDYLRLLLEAGIIAASLYVLFLVRELIHNIRLSSDKTNWFINFPMLVAIIYWVIISSTQNMIYNVIAFPMFLSLIAVSRRWNELTFEEDLKEDVN